MTPGRPSKLNQDVQEKICSVLRGGNFRNVACAFAGVSQRAFREWMRRGEEGESPFDDFRRAVIEAEKSAEIRAVALIIKAAQEDPKHAQWWLSHRFPERWADKTRQELRARHTVDASITRKSDLFQSRLEELTEDQLAIPPTTES